jgi:hypothetical protein
MSNHTDRERAYRALIAKLDGDLRCIGTYAECLTRHIVEEIGLDEEYIDDPDTLGDSEITVKAAPVLRLLNAVRAVKEQEHTKGTDHE